MNRQQRRNAAKQERQEEKRGASYVGYDVRYVPHGTEKEVKGTIVRLIILGILMTAACLCVGSLPVGVLSGNNYYLTIPYLIQLYASIRAITLATRIFRERKRGLQEVVYTRQLRRTGLDTVLLVACAILLLIMVSVRLHRIGMPEPAAVFPAWIVADILNALVAIVYQRTLDGMTFDQKRQRRGEKTE